MSAPQEEGFPRYVLPASLGLLICGGSFSVRVSNSSPILLRSQVTELSGSNVLIYAWDMARSAQVPLLTVTGPRDLCLSSEPTRLWVGAMPTGAPHIYCLVPSGHSVSLKFNPYHPRPVFR